MQESGCKAQHDFREMLKETMNGIVGSLMGNKVIVLVPCREKEESYNEREVKIENIRSMLRKMGQQMEMKFKAGIGLSYPGRKFPSPTEKHSIRQGRE